MQRRTDEEWKVLVVKFQNSDMSMYKWCKQEEVSFSTFRRKFITLTKQDDESAETEAEEVAVEETEAEEPVVEKATVEETEVKEPEAKETEDDEIEEKPSVTEDQKRLAEDLKNDSEDNQKAECALVPSIHSELLPEIGEISWECNKIYLVDTENVYSKSIVTLLEYMDASAKVLLFYTAKSTYIPYEFLKSYIDKRDQLFFISCGTGTHDALDFQLVSALGNIISVCNQDSRYKTKGMEFLIVSDDQGFDAVSEFWQGRNINVGRIGKIEIAKMELDTKLSYNAEVYEKAEKTDETTEIEGTSETEPILEPESASNSIPYEDEIAVYYKKNTQYQKDMRARLSSMLGADLKIRGISIKDKTLLMDAYFKNAHPTASMLSVLTDPETAKELMIFPKELIEDYRKKVYEAMLKKKKK